MPRLQQFAVHVAAEWSNDTDEEPSRSSMEKVALDAALDCLDPATPLVTQLEAERIAETFDQGAIDKHEYALETRLCRRGPRGRVSPTAIGRTFLRLRGKDAVRWLLTVEVLQSQGDQDRWRASRNLLEKAVKEGIQQQWWEGEPYFPFSDESLARLRDFGVLVVLTHAPDDDDPIEYRLRKPMIDVVRSALDEGPWHAAIRALIEDEISLTAPVIAHSAIDATIEQTRMFAHEVRNALGPVRYNVDELLSGELDPPPRERVEAVKKGVVRVLDFVDQMVVTSELVTDPATVFDVEALLREAVGWVDGSEDVKIVPAPRPLRVRGARPRFLRALIDVVRNAIQSNSPAPPVRIAVERVDREVRILIDDGGPGVLAELREEIFRDGFTTRPGGSGFGLAYLRQVVERDLHGRVYCEDSDLGGARFTITVPDPGTEP